MRYGFETLRRVAADQSFHGWVRWRTRISRRAVVLPLGYRRLMTARLCLFQGSRQFPGRPAEQWRGENPPSATSAVGTRFHGAGRTHGAVLLHNPAFGTQIFIARHPRIRPLCCPFGSARCWRDIQPRVPGNPALAPRDFTLKVLRVTPKVKVRRLLETPGRPPPEMGPAVGFSRPADAGLRWISWASGPARWLAGSSPPATAGVGRHARHAVRPLPDAREVSLSTSACLSSVDPPRRAPTAGPACVAGRVRCVPARRGHAAAG